MNMHIVCTLNTRVESSGEATDIEEKRDGWGRTKLCCISDDYIHSLCYALFSVYLFFSAKPRRRRAQCVCPFINNISLRSVYEKKKSRRCHTKEKSWTDDDDKFSWFRGERTIFFFLLYVESLSLSSPLSINVDFAINNYRQCLSFDCIQAVHACCEFTYIFFIHNNSDRLLHGWVHFVFLIYQRGGALSLNDLSSCYHSENFTSLLHWTSTGLSRRRRIQCHLSFHTRTRRLSRGLKKFFFDYALQSWLARKHD